MLRTPFYQFHADHSAKFVDFAGWEMPIHYGSILDEHRHVRAHGGLFDVSHMGRIRITGLHATRLLERLLTRRVGDMTPGLCRYSLVCNERGGVMDDVIAYRLDEEEWLLVVNASNRQKILNHLLAQAGSSRVKIDDQTESTAMIAAQGPDVMDTIAPFSSEVPTLKRYRFCVKNLIFMKLTISRTGYTGEDGVEVILPANAAMMAIKLLLREASGNGPSGGEAGSGSGGGPSIKPAGLGARDTLRMEAAMPLYGHELDEQTDPLSAGLNFAVNLDKGSTGQPADPRFIGQDALEKIAANGPAKRLVGLKLEGRRTARQGMTVLESGRHAGENSGGKSGGAGGEIGKVTSGCLSPTLGYPIALAYVDAPYATPQTPLTIMLGEQPVPAHVVKLPFYKR